MLREKGIIPFVTEGNDIGNISLSRTLAAANPSATIARDGRVAEHRRSAKQETKASRRSSTCGPNRLFAIVAAKRRFSDRLNRPIYLVAGAWPPGAHRSAHYFGFIKA